MENKVLATISGVEITENDLNAIIMRYPADKRGMFNSEMGKKQLLEQMISFDLMYKLGNEMKINETEEYKANLAQVEKDLLTQTTINKVLAEVTVTDDEAKKYYDEHKNEFEQPATVSAKHILVDNEELCSDVKSKIENGELSFEEAARQYSTCPSKEQGGNLGVSGRGMMVPEFEEAAFDDIELQIRKHYEFNDVKNQIIQKLIQENQEKKYLDLMKELEAKYDVKRF